MKKFLLSLPLVCFASLGAVVLASPAAPGYHLIKKVPLGAAPGGGEYFDYVTVDSASRRVYLSHGAKVKVLDADNFSVVGAIYDDNEEKNDAAVVDTHAFKIKARWPLAPAGGPVAMAMDREHRRLFSSARDPQFLVMTDADNGKVIQSLPISAGVDGSIFEPETGLLYVSTGEGNIHIFYEDSPNKLTEAETVKTESGAKTMGFDPKTHNLFLTTADFGPAPPVPTKENPEAERKPIPGTFRVLIYGR
jgi:hypothetical protein